MSLARLTKTHRKARTPQVRLAPRRGDDGELAQLNTTRRRLAQLMIDHPSCAANLSLLLDKIEGEIDGRRRVAGALDRARAILGEASG